MVSLQGKNIIVTGGSHGIGLAIATKLSELGAGIVICSRNKEMIEEVCVKNATAPQGFYGITADVSSAADCKRLVAFVVEKLGGVDVLINNAGTFGEVGPFDTIDIDNWSKTIATNFLGAVTCSRFVIPEMKKQGGGKIINFAGGGVGGKKPLANFSAYYSSKVAVVGFTETLAQEMEGYNIQVNCISPGAINTGITDYLIAQGPVKVGNEMYEQILKQKEGTNNNLELTIDLVKFLCSGESDHLTGRMLSAKWDSIDTLRSTPKGGDLFKLRRIDNDLFYGK
jgi:NAD(P)-dependent dehydrogenase (short-subunit alcohol dehydrogenase family)